MTDIVTRLNATANLVKSVLALPGVAASAEAKHQVSQLLVELAELKTEMATLMNENARLQNELKKREQVKLVLKEGLYFGDDGDGPYCTACYDIHHDVIHVVALPHALIAHGRWRCPKCTTKYR